MLKRFSLSQRNSFRKKSLERFDSLEIFDCFHHFSSASAQSHKKKVRLSGDGAAIDEITEKSKNTNN